MENCADLAKENKSRWVTIECTSAYSAALAEKHGFKVAREIPYEEIKLNGKSIFHSKPPHMSYRLLIKDLK